MRFSLRWFTLGSDDSFKSSESNSLSSSCPFPSLPFFNTSPSLPPSPPSPRARAQPSAVEAWTDWDSPECEESA